MPIWTLDDNKIDDNDTFGLLKESLKDWLAQQTDKGRKRLIEVLEINIPYQG